MATKDTGGGQQKATRNTEEVEEAPEAQASEDLVHAVYDELPDVLDRLDLPRVQ
ncbi:ubiquitin-like protein Pup, partial [Streptomyces umbrinus]